MNYFNYLLGLLLLSIIAPQSGCAYPHSGSVFLPPDTSKTLKTIAFGSCNRVNLPQDIWKSIHEDKPDLWLWLGDIIYADTENMSKLENMYNRQKSNEEYVKFISETPVIGIWDDHDYGQNDGGKDFSKKVESQQLLLDFLDVSKDAPVRKREGIYQSYTFGVDSQTVKIILLDTRYFRDELQSNPTKETRYLINETGDVLGETQWKWLEKELSESDAKINIICSSIQVIAEEQAFEKWANFPTARQRLLDLILKTQPNNPLILSGDRHIAEVAKIEMEGLNQPLFEVTSSGLTHAYTKAGAKKEQNKYRVGEVVNQRHFALLKIDWETVRLTIEIRGVENELLYTKILE